MDFQEAYLEICEFLDKIEYEIDCKIEEDTLDEESRRYQFLFALKYRPAIRKRPSRALKGPRPRETRCDFITANAQ